MSTARGKGLNFKWLQDRLNIESDECLIWPFSKDEKGYGRIGYCGKFYRTHRLVCIMVNGEPPTPQHQAAHTCGNGLMGCVHPRHVEWKTDSENKQDIKKHRGKYPHSQWGQKGKFTDDQVRDLRRLASTTSQIKLAKQFEISPSALRDILKGKSYKHVA